MAILAQTSNRDRIWNWTGALFFGLGVLALIYAVYDLRYPSHFVGDMYGMEVIFRVVMLGGAAAPMLFGVVLLTWGSRRTIRNFCILGTVVIVVSSSVLIANAVGIAQSRNLDRIREAYPAKSVDELLAVARDKKDQHAIDVLAAKADPASVPGLALILLNENERGNLRYCAAQALGRIGSEDARKALDKARDSSKDEYFKGLISQIIEDMRPRTR
jgi:hypothetical protein